MNRGVRKWDGAARRASKLCGLLERLKMTRLLKHSIDAPDTAAPNHECVALTPAQDMAELELWYHGGTQEENDETRAQVDRFNAMQDEIQVNFVELAGSLVAGTGYNDAVNAAAVAGDLPCILDLDGPNLYNYAWAGFLAPMDDYMSDELRADILPSLIDQGTYNGKIYAMGQYDSGLALVGRISLLEEAGAFASRASIDDAWDLDEFNNVLAQLQALESVEYAIDLKMNYGAGEWYTYAFSPVVQAFGGDLIDTETLSAEEVLNGPEAVAAMEWIRSLFENGYSTLTPPDDNEFINGNAAMGFLGHWMATGYYEAFGDDMIVLPVVNFGARQATGMGFLGLVYHDAMRAYRCCLGIHGIYADAGRNPKHHQCQCCGAGSPFGIGDVRPVWRRRGA